MGIMRKVIEDTIGVVEGIPLLGLALSPAAVNAQNMPNTITEKAFSVTMQTDNSGKFRDKSPAGVMRYEHILTVGLLCRILPNNQVEGYNNAIDIEESIILEMLNQANFPAYRVLYDRSRRTLPGAGEYVLIEIDFNIEQTTKVP